MLKVLVPHATFTAWVQGTPSVGEHVGAAAVADSVPEAGVRVRLFSTNDYLGLSSHSAVRAAYVQAGGEVGSGPRASALVAGYTSAHRALEADLAALKHSQECLLFPTGFAANTSVVQARRALGLCYTCTVLANSTSSVFPGAGWGFRL